ncbi:pilus assembly protein CpaE [Comamonas sp.]|uniref:AAA family ATPase n=1 Tax=Comamonas sp. TaxID=34028 RepID=UPI00289C4D00|nr:pilus assembly protein CpaE [Comamonas sp.]
MNKDSLAPHSAGPAPESPSLADLLTPRPVQARPAPADASERPALRAVPPSLTPVPASAENHQGDSPATVPLLLVQAPPPQGALALVWMQRLLGGAQPHIAQSLYTVAEQVQQLQPQAVLVQFDCANVEASTALVSQLQQAFPHIPRVAIGHAQDAECLLAALRAGVQDFLDLDAPLEPAQRVVSQLLARPAAVDHRRADAAPITALLSARAGLGCSLLASHLAWHLQEGLSPARTGKAAAAPHHAADAQSLHTLLLDMGASGGDCAIYLNTPGEFSLADALSQQRRLDKRMAASALSHHPSGLRLLSMPRHAALPAAGEIDALVQRLGQYFEHLVLDLGADTPLPVMAEVLPQADQIWLVCDQSVASVVWTAELLQQLQAIGIAPERIELIVNRHDSRLELAAAHMAAQLQLPLLASIPERRRPLMQEVNRGQLLQAQRRSEPYVKAVGRLAGKLLAEHHPQRLGQHSSAAGPLQTLLQRLRGH